jgi:hypothetical protein
LLVALYGFEAVTLNEEQRMAIFEKRQLRRILGLKNEKVM